MKKTALCIIFFFALSFTVNGQNMTTKLKISGVEMVETISDDGSSIIKKPYRWFAGMADADVESVAIEMATLEAFAAISRTIENVVAAKAQGGYINNNGNVQRALKSHWEQMSMSIQNASEPMGDAESTYDRETGMYHVMVKVGIRGDRYVKILNDAKNVSPDGLTGQDLQQFIQTNDAIIDAAKDN